ncbi:hypothetical protein S245_024852 [Arachis hypogaea]
MTFGCGGGGGVAAYTDPASAEAEKFDASFVARVVRKADLDAEIVSETAENCDSVDPEKETSENKVLWDLAVECGAAAYDDEEDIMSILQEQNEAQVLRRGQAKQKKTALGADRKEHDRDTIRWGNDS